MTGLKPTYVMLQYMHTTEVRYTSHMIWLPVACTVWCLSCIVVDMLQANMDAVIVLDRFYVKCIVTDLGWV